MAPTICSDKKQQQHARPHSHHQLQHHQQHHHQQQQQQLRIRDMRRRRQLQYQQQQILKATAASNNGATATNVAPATAVSTTTATTLFSSSSLSSSSSSMFSNVVSFAIKGAMNSSMSSTSSPASPSSLLPTSSSPSPAPFRLRLRGRRAELLHAQISDNAVSSSTHFEDEDNNILPLSDSATVSLNDSDSALGYEYLTDYTSGGGGGGNDSETTMDVDSDAENIHADIVGGMGLDMFRLRHYVQLRETVLKAKETRQRQQHQLPLAQLSANNKDGNYQTWNTQGLLGIALKTIKLAQRNQLLQKRLAQLQVETSEFIASVLANPENKHFRERITANAKLSKNIKHF